MGKKVLIMISCIIMVLFSINVVAGDYDLQGTDPTGDVKDLQDNGNFTTAYPDLDITSATVEEDGDNVIFTLQVLGEIVPNNSSIRYVFRIESQEASGFVDLYFKNPYKCYVFRQSPYLKVDCTYELDGGKVTITAPKTAFDDVSTPWDVTAIAKVYLSKDIIIDELELSYDVPSEDDTGGDGDSGSSSSTGSLPSFDAITIIIGLFMAILIVIAVVFVFWSKKRKSQ